MGETPWLPLSPGQARALITSLDRVIAREPTGGTALPRIPERVVVELVRILHEERAGGLPGQQPAPGKGAPKRARRIGAIGGLAGMLGVLPAEALHLVEEARVAVAHAAHLPHTRRHEHIAADLLVLWGLVADGPLAETIGDGTGPSLLDTLYARSADQVKAAIPEKWNAIGTLSFLWRMRDVRKVRDVMPGGVLRNIPIVGTVPGWFHAHRDMRAFQRDAARYYDALATPGGAVA